MPLMESDSAQHATMAMRMYLSDNFFEIMRGNEPYLDKPHMHFWLAAISFKIFGLTEWAYRLPSLLFTFIGAVSCFYLAKELYTKKAAHFASLIFLTSQSIILANHDVRTDAILTGATIFAIWQLFKFTKNQRVLPLILGSFALGIAFSTKGMIAVVITLCALLSHLAYSKKLRILISYKILIGLLIFFISISPVLYAYYVQFGEEGVRFILWEQNFKRLSSENMKQSNPGYLFLFHTLIWVFFPWAFTMYSGLFTQLKKWISNKFKKIDDFEFLTIGGAFITILLLSYSKFKLPHYLNPVLPLLSIFTAGFLYKLEQNQKTKILNILLKINYFFVFIGFVAVTFILIFTFETPSVWIISGVVLISFLLISFLILTKKQSLHQIIISSALLMIMINFVLNTYFYPNLLEYQGGGKIAKIIKEKNIDLKKIYLYKQRYSWSLDFATERNTPELSIDEIKKSKTEVWLYIDKSSYIDTITNANIKISEKYSVPHFRVSKLSLKFLNQKTRKSKVGSAYLLKISSNFLP